MSARLTKPLIVPEYNNGLIKLYTPKATTGEAEVNPKYTINLKTVLDTLFPPDPDPDPLKNKPPRVPAPNCCKLNGVDLFVAQSSGNSQAVIKFPGYLKDPVTAQAQAFVFTLDGNDYVGLTFDKVGNLYVAEGSFGDNNIVRYGGIDVAYPGAGAASNNNYANKKVIGIVGITPSYFANLVFDAAGNLWVTDTRNNRVVAFDEAGLNSGANSYHVLGNVGPIDVGPIISEHLFAQPEGLDFDSFDANANLWVANNNDDGPYNSGITNTMTSLVMIPKLALEEVLKPSNPPKPLAGFVINQDSAGGKGITQFGGLQVDKAARRLYVNEEVQNNGRAYDLNKIMTPLPNSATDGQLAITSTNPGNGGIALLELGAYIADTPSDSGLEPDTTTTLSWQSPAISVDQKPGVTGTVPKLPDNVSVLPGQACTVYVEVRNFGPTPTLEIEVLEVNWASPHTSSTWPKPWDGSVFDEKPFETSAMGGSIATGIAIPKIPPSSSVVIAVPWEKTPDPLKYTVQDRHFCLLARIVTPGLGADGMSYPEGSVRVEDNYVLQNARIALRNIHINDPSQPAAPGAKPKSHWVRTSNYGGKARNVRLAFELLDAEAQPIRVPTGPLQITATGTSLETLRRSSLGDTLHGDGPVPLQNIDAGIDNLTIAPDETVTFAVDYLPANPADAYALRVSQFVKEASGETLVGGQTFINGYVKGFNIKPETPEPSAGSLVPKWFWWVLLLVLLGLLILFV